MTTARAAFDLVVVGTGAGGSGAASKCRAAGWRVAVVDDQPFGGTCELRGCDPKKVLVGAAEVVDWAQRMTGHGLTGESSIDWPALMRFKRTFTDPVPARHASDFERAGIVALRGEARFTADDCMLVTSDDGSTHELHATHFLIASGAEPQSLGITGEEHVRTSTDLLDLDTLPARIAFIGAGYVSFEFAHVVQRAGAHAIVLGRSTPLGHFDQDLVQRLVVHTRAIGVTVHTDANVTSVERTGRGYRVHTHTATGAEAIDADLVVHGAGRLPRTAHLDLARGHISTGAQRAIVVNEYMQSNTNPRVYAVGDCTHPPGSLPLTPVAAHEGLVAAYNLLHGNTKTPDYRGVSSVVFTTPPLATVGVTEATARARGLRIRVKYADTANWFSSRRVLAHATMYKTIVDDDTDRILGAHLLGPDAADVINIFALAVRHGITARELRQMIYAYPTATSDVSSMV